MFDVNAARKQRIEARGSDFAFKVDDDVFHMPLEVSREKYNELKDVPDGDLDGTLRVLLGDEQFDRLVTHELTVTDLGALLQEHQKLSTPPGEAKASKSS